MDVTQPVTKDLLDKAGLTGLALNTMNVECQTGPLPTQLTALKMLQMMMYTYGLEPKETCNRNEYRYMMVMRFM